MTHERKAPARSDSEQALAISNPQIPPSYAFTRHRLAEGELASAGKKSPLLIHHQLPHTNFLTRAETEQIHTVRQVRAVNSDHTFLLAEVGEQNSACCVNHADLQAGRYWETEYNVRNATCRVGLEAYACEPSWFFHAAGILQIRTDQFVKSEICIIYDDFGPLGPSFRGRDIVRVRDITADTITECLLLYQPNMTTTNTITTTNGALNSTTREAIEWMCIVHQQANKTRPMSVRVPMIRFK